MRKAAALLIALASVLPLGAQNDPEKQILSVIEDAFQAGRTYANVPAADGRMLRIVTEAMNAKHVVEIGTSTGISGLWFALALRNTGGKLTTFELDNARADTAQEHFRKAGVDKLITIVRGDAHKRLAEVKETIDVAFIDAEKSGYIDYLRQLLPKMRSGGVIFAHNTGMVADYVKAVSSDPKLETVIYTSGGGMALSLKKR